MSTRKNSEPESHPSTPRRALLTGGAVGLAAVAGATLGRPQAASAQTTENVTFLEPSGVASTDTGNIVNALNSDSFVWLGPGVFEIDEVIQIPHKAEVLGVGASTRVMCNGDAGFYMHDTTASDGSSSAANSSGCIRDLIIDGTNANAGSIGLDIGDGWGYRLDHIFVENFTGADSIGYRIGNDYYYTEKMRGTNLHARNCTTLVYMNTTISSDVSHGYNDLEFCISLNPGGPANTQSAFTFDDGVNYYGGSLLVRGNQYYLADAPDPGPWFFGLTGSITDKGGHTYYSQILECLLDVRVEGDPNGSNVYSVNRLYAENSSNGIFDCWGRFTMTGSNGTPTAQQGQFQLSGLVPSVSMVPIRTEAPDWEPPITINVTTTPPNGTQVTNDTGSNVMVYLDGGTLMVPTQINGIALGDTSTRQYYLPQGQTIEVAYSGSMSWYWQSVAG
jgi:hypothetical protein